MSEQDYYKRMATYYDGPKYGGNFAWVRQCIEERWVETSGHWHIIDFLEDAKRILAGRQVLELACGAGYWTKYLSSFAQRVVATDTSNQLLDLVRDLLNGIDNVTTKVLDALDPTSYPVGCNAAFHFNLINHVSRRDWPRFISVLHGALDPGSRVLMGAQRCVGVASATSLGIDADPLDRADQRRCPDGSEYVIIDNELSEGDLQTMLEGRAKKLRITLVKRMWWASYEVTD